MYEVTVFHETLEETKHLIFPVVPRKGELLFYYSPERKRSVAVEVSDVSYRFDDNDDTLVNISIIVFDDISDGDMEKWKIKQRK